MGRDVGDSVTALYKRPVQFLALHQSLSAAPKSFTNGLSALRAPYPLPVRLELCNPFFGLNDHLIQTSRSHSLRLFSRGFCGFKVVMALERRWGYRLSVTMEIDGLNQSWGNPIKGIPFSVALSLPLCILLSHTRTHRIIKGRYL